MTFVTPKLNINNDRTADFRLKILTPFVRKPEKRLIGLFLCLSSLLISPAVFSEDSSETQDTNSSVEIIHRSPFVSNKIDLDNLNKLDTISTDISNIAESLGDILTSIEEDEEVIEDETTDVEVTEIEEKEELSQPVQPVIAKPEIENPNKIEVSKIESQPVQTTSKTEEQEKAIPLLSTNSAPALKPLIEERNSVKKPATKKAKITSGNKYLKLGDNGDNLAKNSETWTCVEDTNNGLVWEVKSQDGGIRDKNNSYTWFQPSSMGVNHGIADGGKCKGDTECDTQSYVQALNEQNYCGYSDWRLPTREEMLSIVYFENTASSAKINSNYFPEAMPSWYWTASSNENHPEHAWYVLFKNGIAINDLKQRAKHIRLVRSDKNT